MIRVFIIIDKLSMKKVLITVLLWRLIIPCVFSQQIIFSQPTQKEEDVGQIYYKTVEKNYWVKYGNHNLKSKTGREELFFGDFNAPVEFFYDHPFEGDGVYGFRIRSDSLKKKHILEVKYISNYKKAQEEARQKYPTVGYDLRTEDNRAALAKQYEEIPKLYKIDTLSFSVSNQFAEELFEEILFFIRNFNSKLVSGICFDCPLVVFRTVDVNNDEQCTLKIISPRGNARKLTNFCRKIINDAINDQFDETKYIFDFDTLGY